MNRLADVHAHGRRRGSREADQELGRQLLRPDQSTDKHFRPSDPQIGPDGALWFGDWANALIGHMQYSQRDETGTVRGGIYRLAGKDKPLLKPVTQFGKPVPEILEQLREYEWRTRYRARRELHDRPASEVLPAVKEWAAKLLAQAEDKTDRAKWRLLCEALWAQESHHAIDSNLLNALLAAPVPEARAAATRVLADERDRIPGALDQFKKLVTDSHPRVRTEALRGAQLLPDAGRDGGGPQRRQTAARLLDEVHAGTPWGRTNRSGGRTT